MPPHSIWIGTVVSPEGHDGKPPNLSSHHLLLNTSYVVFLMLIRAARICFYCDSDFPSSTRKGSSEFTLREQYRSAWPGCVVQFLFRAFADGIGWKLICAEMT